MRATAEHLLLSPSDLNHFLECEHLLTLERHRAPDEPRNDVRDPHADLLARKGADHEQAWLERFQRSARRVVTIAGAGRDRDWQADARATAQAMRDGAEVIYQAVFVDGTWRGISDFVVRVEQPSSLGGWSYEAWDTKLARRTKPYFVLQLCFYSEQIARLQGRAPESMVVVLGSGEQQRLRHADFDAYYRAVRSRFLSALTADTPTYPYPVPHCRLCEHQRACHARWQSDDHLSRVAGIRREQVQRLNEAGIRTAAQLGAMDATRRIGIGPVALERLRHQAALQTSHRTSGAHSFDVLRADERSGFRLLPKPSPGDMFFDMEGDPYFEASRGLEYLFGVITQPHGEGSELFTAFRALSRDEERIAFERFIDFVHAGLRNDPDLHVYHYAPYETSALKRLASDFGAREDALDDLLRREIFVDLYQVVRQSVRISHASYSIKKVRTFFMAGAGAGAVTDGGDSILEFERWRETGDASILDAIEAYNREDCESTVGLRDWLLERKIEAEARDGVSIAWKATAVLRESPEREQEDDATRLRREALQALAGAGSVPASGQPNLFEQWPADDAQADRARFGLLAELLDYHRRELKPAYWAYFDRRKKSMDELVDDTEAIAELTPAPDVPPRPINRSIEYAFDFPPQEFKLSAGSDYVDDPFRAATAGQLTRIDAERGRLWLKRGSKRQHEPLPRAIVTGAPRDTGAQRRAIGRAADAAIAAGAAPAASRYRAIDDLLRRSRPRLAGAERSRLQTLDLDEQRAIVSALDHSYLVIQGPPGSGKTFTGARLIVSLIGAGKRIGIAANSHKAINNLLGEVERAASASGLVFRGLKKNSDDDDEFEGDVIGNTRENADCESPDVRLVAATSWLFSRPEMDQAFDYLFVDEAGQVALADAVAMATAARNIVLLGDPQQLPQVRQGMHPPGAGCSVLEHLLGEHQTVPEDGGIFLARSWRMHPDICRFISELSYDGRLDSATHRERQRVDSAGLSGAGLRCITVEHDGNAQQSYEEVRVVAQEVKKLLNDGTVTDVDGRMRPLVPADILVVAPYNMQVRALKEKLPDGVEVGTVDRFQGREAHVVFFSMASSSGEDVPRGLEFLFSRNRFNVALSRARSLAVVVCNPRLLETRCTSVGQMRLVNALCRFVEQARLHLPR